MYMTFLYSICFISLIKRRLNWKMLPGILKILFFWINVNYLLSYTYKNKKNLFLPLPCKVHGMCYTLLNMIV